MNKSVERRTHYLNKHPYSRIEDFKPSKRYQTSAKQKRHEEQRLQKKIQFMDVAVAVLASLREQENSFICEKEIDDLWQGMDYLSNPLGK